LWTSVGATKIVRGAGRLVPVVTDTSIMARTDRKPSPDTGSAPVLVSRLREVQIRNYKSIGQARVPLGPLTILVGPNGAGKSNFLDALAFVSDCLADSIELAFKNRGGLSAVRRRSGGHPTHIGMRLVIDLDPNTVADYAFEIAAEKGEGFSVARERCEVSEVMGAPSRCAYEVNAAASVARSRLNFAKDGERASTAARSSREKNAAWSAVAT
jgi:hypothetical protein